MATRRDFLKAGAVVKLDEVDAFAVAAGFYPAVGFNQRACGLGQDGVDGVVSSDHLPADFPIGRRLR